MRKKLYLFLLVALCGAMINSAVAKKKNKKKNSVKIVAVKSGKAKVQVKAGKKKYTCTVTVKSAKKTNTTKKPTVTKPTSSAKNKNDVSVIKRIILN